MPPADLDRLSHSDLKSLVLKLLGEVAHLRRTVAAQRDEIARLKGGSGRPNIKPSGMDKATEPKPPPTAEGEPRPNSRKTSKLSIDEERTVKVTAPPHGSRFKGYTNFVVQDLMIRPHVVNFRCERWQRPDGAMVTAPLPAGISGHFGPQLRISFPRTRARRRRWNVCRTRRDCRRIYLLASRLDTCGQSRMRSSAVAIVSSWSRAQATSIRSAGSRWKGSGSR